MSFREMKVVTTSLEQYLGLTSSTEKEEFLSTLKKHQIAEVFELNAIPYRCKDMKKDLIMKVKNSNLWTPSSNIQLSETWSRKWQQFVPETLRILSKNALQQSNDEIIMDTTQWTTKRKGQETKRRKVGPTPNKGQSKLSPDATEEQINAFLDDSFNLAAKALLKDPRTIHNTT